MSYGCFRIPAGCVDGDCKIFHKWVEDGDSVLFELNGRYEDYPAMDKIWLAIGFSFDQSMVIIKLFIISIFMKSLRFLNFYREMIQ